MLKRYEGRAHMLEGPDFLLDRQTYTLYIHNKSVVLPGNQGKLLEAFLLHGANPVKKRSCLPPCGEPRSISMKMRSRSI